MHCLVARNVRIYNKDSDIKFYSKRQEERAFCCECGFVLSEFDCMLLALATLSGTVHVHVLLGILLRTWHCACLLMANFEARCLDMRTGTCEVCA